MIKLSDNQYLELFLKWLREDINKLHYINLSENLTQKNFISTLKKFNKYYFKVDIPIEDSKLKSIFELIKYNKEKL